MSAARISDRHIGEHASGTAGEQKDAVGEPDHLVDIVADEQRRNRPPRDQLGKFGAQPRRQCRIEGDERLVEHEKLRLDRERARQGDPARETDRKLAGIMATVFGEAERAEQAIHRGVACLRRGKPHVLFDRAPRQQPRFLEYNTEPAVRRQPHAAFEFRIEPDDDAKQRGLAAAGRTDQRRDFAIRQSERHIAEHVEVGRRSGLAIGFALDADFKPVLGRQRETCRSNGCTTNVSIASMTATKARA